MRMIRECTSRNRLRFTRVSRIEKIRVQNLLIRFVFGFVIFATTSDLTRRRRYLAEDIPNVVRGFTTNLCKKQENH